METALAARPVPRTTDGGCALEPGSERLRRVAVCLAIALSISVSIVEAQSEAALRIHAGSVASDQVVALGRDLVVEGEALGDVAVLSGSIHLSGRVVGDAIVLGGSAFLAPTARLEGDLFVLGGSIDAAPGATIGGRSVSYPTVSAAWLTLLEGPSFGRSVLSPLVIGTKLALIVAWLVLLLVFLATSGREVMVTSEQVAAEPFRNFFVGLTAIVTLFLTAAFFSAFAAAIVGLPLLALVVVLALVLKLWGMVGVFHAVGAWLIRDVLKRRTSPLNAAATGLFVLGVLKFVPHVGTWTWTVATLIGVGSTLTTKFGRRQAWFDTDELERLATLSR